MSAASKFQQTTAKARKTDMKITIFKELIERIVTILKTKRQEPTEKTCKIFIDKFCILQNRGKNRASFCTRLKQPDRSIRTVFGSSEKSYPASDLLRKLMVPARLERAPEGFESARSIQLSYGTIANAGIKNPGVFLKCL